MLLVKKGLMEVIMFNYFHQLLYLHKPTKFLSLPKSIGNIVDRLSPLPIFGWI